MTEDEQAILSNAWRLATKDAEDYALVNAELLGRINRLTETCKRLEDVVKSYKSTTSETRVILTMAVYERDRARDIAARLEAECANCWGPVHKAALDEVHRAR